MTIETLQADFNAQIGNAKKLQLALIEQLDNLFTINAVSVGVPIEGRVKTWPSIAEKLERKFIVLNAIGELDDFVGIRVILLFRTDLAIVDRLLNSTFQVISAEDTGDRLSENQFGYQSKHYIIKIPTTWIGIPSFAHLGKLKAEIQVRTLAQHIWAVASHKLQYKHEASVPPPIRRAIHRVSALLETVDLEFERVLDERKKYVENDIVNLSPTERLNVDIIKSILSELLPPLNKSDDENYAELLDDLFHFGIKTSSELSALLNSHMKAILQADAETVVSRLSSDDEDDHFNFSRLAVGVFFTHVGLTRQALSEEFGHETFAKYITSVRQDD